MCVGSVEEDRQVWDFVQNSVLPYNPTCPGDTPGAPNDGRQTQATDRLAHTMADKSYHRTYWQAYKKRTKQISVTLSLEDYKMLAQAASRQGRRSVGQQLKAEALAYRTQSHLPEIDTQNYLTELIRILRGIGTNLNQIAKHSNTVQQAIGEQQVIQMLQTLEATAEGFTRATHTTTNPED